jgi:anti-sigma-K factor RskA
MTAEANGATHATIRETYDLVSETRQELNERIDSLGDKIDSFVTTSEHRLTVLETHQGAQAERLGKIDARLDEHGKMIGHLKDKQREDEASTEAIEEQTKSRWANHATAITVVASAVLAIATILSLFRIKF